MKKLLGVILIGVAALILLGEIVQIPAIITKLSVPEEQSGAYHAGYVIGYIGGHLLFIILAFFGFKYGRRLLKS